MNETVSNAAYQSHEEWANEEIRRRRRLAYADKITGSDVMLIEAERMRSTGEQGWEEAKAAAVARAGAIKESLPIPFPEHDGGFGNNASE